MIYKLHGVAISLLFLSVIFASLPVTFFAAGGAVSTSEKRKLAAMPAMPANLKQIQAWPGLFDDYFADNFGMRNLYTSVYQRAKFSIGDSSSEHVTVGQDGWLFLGGAKPGYKGHSDPIGDVRNVNLFSPSKLRRLTRYLLGLSAWLRERDIEYVLVIAPNKHTIYFDKLPPYIRRENEKSALDQLVAYLRANVDFPVVDLRAPLSAERARRDVYFKTDTHWNHVGANIAQYEIHKVLHKLVPEIGESQLFPLKEEAGPGGDLARMLGIDGFREQYSLPMFPDGCKPRLVEGSEKDRAPYTLHCAGRELNALVFHDSFFSALQPYFSRKFARTTYVWNRSNYDLVQRYVNKQKLDLVIEEWAERFLPFAPRSNNGFERLWNKHNFDAADAKVFSAVRLAPGKPPRVRFANGSGKAGRFHWINNAAVYSLPALPIVAGREYVLRAKVNASVDSKLLVYYSPGVQSGRHFSSKRVLRVNIPKGSTQVYLALDAPDLGKYLRFDVIPGRQSFSLEALELRQVSRREDGN